MSSENIDKVLNAGSKKELMEAYGQWADKYDNDLRDEMGYVAPVIASELLQKYLKDKTVRILDAGCGTGLVGEFLHRNGYRNIDGLDYSSGMLEQAGEKEVYRTLRQADLTKTLDMETDTYDAVISVGTFTCGHVGPSAFAELVRITRPGGYICFTVREQAWKEDNYRAEISLMEKNGLWEPVEEKTADYIQEEGSVCRICLYRIAS